GLPIVNGKWCQIAKKGVPIDAKELYREKFACFRPESNPPSISLSMDIYSYSGDDQPTWAMDVKDNLLPNFRKVCTITAELYDVEGALQRQIGLFGNVYWQLRIDVCIRFGTTELQAHLEWEQNGVKRQGPATVVPGKPIDI
ncbi:unnamed protein product, partial [Rhizoctonia solani]